MNLLDTINNELIASLMEGKSYPVFAPGDTIRVNVKISEGANERVQSFEGVCIAIKRRGLDSSFIVRKLSHGEGVERQFPLYSPRIDSIEMVRRGIVRRAKLFYMRELRGKAARIREKKDFTSTKKTNQ